jgi:hypothetical protein
MTHFDSLPKYDGASDLDRTFLVARIIADSRCCGQPRPGICLEYNKIDSETARESIVTILMIPSLLVS